MFEQLQFNLHYKKKTVYEVRIYALQSTHYHIQQNLQYSTYKEKKKTLINSLFGYLVNESMELFGVTIDKDLTFKQHVPSICKKVNNQFSVMTRFGKLMSTETMLRLYKAFILPHFYCCSMVWQFSSKQDFDKLDLLNKRILRFILKDFNSEYNNLLKKTGTANLKDKRLQNMILTIFNFFHFSDYPRYKKKYVSLTF